MNPKPVIFLAFANDRSDAQAYLKELDKERLALDDMLTAHEWCTVKVKTEASLGRIMETFGKYKRDIRIFHFSGHASPEGIQLEGKEGKESAMAFAKPLADYVGQQEGVQLVFLNGCSTEEQVKAFHKADIPIVIATTRPIEDSAAREFAEHFYKGLTEGLNIRIAFEQAENKLLIPYASSEEIYAVRGFKVEELDWDLDRPYNIHIHPRYPDAGEMGLKDWNETQMEDETADIPSEISPEAYLLCNRHSENTQFDFYFRPLVHQKPRKPQFFIIHGPDVEEPMSLARRFIKFTVPDIYNIHKGRIRTKRPWLIDLPQKRDFEHGDPNMPTYQRNKEFQDKFRLKVVNAREIVRKTGKNIDVAFIQHNILAAHWHKGLAEFLKDYMQNFWKEELANRDPQLIVLFNMIYDSEGSWISKFRSPEKKIEQALIQLGSDIDNCTLINKLPPVEKGDVEKWRIDFMDSETHLVKDIFNNKKKQPMRVVQKELKNAIERWNERLNE